MGESVISLSAGIANLSWKPLNLMAAITGFVMVSSMWSCPSRQAIRLVHGAPGVAALPHLQHSDRSGTDQRRPLLPRIQYILVGLTATMICYVLLNQRYCRDKSKHLEVKPSAQPSRRTTGTQSEVNTLSDF